jgi:hypothetical protein
MKKKTREASSLPFANLNYASRWVFCLIYRNIWNVYYLSIYYLFNNDLNRIYLYFVWLLKAHIFVSDFINKLIMFVWERENLISWLRLFSFNKGSPTCLLVVFCTVGRCLFLNIEIDTHTYTKACYILYFLLCF